MRAPSQRRASADPSPRPQPTALVTGGASGLGRAFCLQLAGEGYAIALVDRDRARGERTAAEVRAAGGTVQVHIADVTDEPGMVGVAQRLQEVSVDLRMLVLCAGDVHVGALVDHDRAADIRSDIDTDLWGAVLSCRVFVPLMPDRSRVVLISSGFGFFGAAGYAAYCAAKAGVIVFGDALRRELLYRRIRVHVACPGDTDTPMLARERSEQPDWMNVASARYSVSTPETMVRRILRKCRGRRLLVVVNPEIRFVQLVDRFLPAFLRNALFDRMFARPKAAGGAP